MREFTHHLCGPLAPARDVMDNDNAGEFSRAGRAGVIGLTLIAVVAAEWNDFRGQSLIITHDALSRYQVLFQVLGVLGCVALLIAWGGCDDSRALPNLSSGSDAGSPCSCRHGR